MHLIPFFFSISGFCVSKRKHFITLFVCLVGWLVVLMETFMELYSVDIVNVHWNILYIIIIIVAAAVVVAVLFIVYFVVVLRAFI